MKIKLTQTQTEILTQKIGDDSIPLTIRKSMNQELMDQILNPKDNFDPNTFDPMDGVENYDIKRRDRVKPPQRLPTMGMLPKQILEGQMIGAFESKQDLFLIFAHYINDLLDRIEVLEKRGQTKK